MTDRDIVQLFEAHHPGSVEEIEALGVSCVYIRQGCARKVYRIGNLAVKIDRKDAWQTKKEIECMRMAHEDPALQPFRQHIPPLFYGNEMTGVIVTKFYPRAVPDDIPHNDKFKVLRKKMEFAGIGDLHFNNFRLDENDTFVAIDLGYYNKRGPEAQQA